MSQNALTLKRDLHSIPEKNAFAVSFINNPEQLRLRAINKLNSISKVDVFGRSVGNYVANKIEASSPYWFSVCFENDLYPGYVTEKVLEAWIAKTIPIYWGDDASGILNPDAVINLKDFKNLQEMAQHVSNLYQDESEMLRMICQPLVKKEFSLDNFASELRIRLMEQSF
jgi:hypothetical protein